MDNRAAGNRVVSGDLDIEVIRCFDSCPGYGGKRQYSSTRGSLFRLPGFARILDGVVFGELNIVQIAAGSLDAAGIRPLAKIVR